MNCAERKIVRPKTIKSCHLKLSFSTLGNKPYFIVTSNNTVKDANPSFPITSVLLKFKLKNV